MRKRLHRIEQMALLLIFVFLGGVWIQGCGQKVSEVTPGVSYYKPDDTQEEETEKIQEHTLYVIVSHDSAQGIIRLWNQENKKEYQYYYSFESRFLDKYGNYTTAADFTIGRGVFVNKIDVYGKLMEVQIADTTWEYEDIVRFSIDEDREILTIADSNYNYSEETFVFPNEERGVISDIKSEDEIRVVGLGKDILSVVVTTGQGTLRLTNTELFEGSYLQLGKRIFVEITPELEIEVSEGDYELVVANDGWGGKTNVTITRGETTEVDLDSIKGDGPKYGSIKFELDIEGAILTVDGVIVDPVEPISLKYGKHYLTVTASGYDTWSRYLYVNSEEATLEIALTSDILDETESEEESEEESETETEKSNNSTEVTLESDNTEVKETNSETNEEKTGAS